MHKQQFRLPADKDQNNTKDGDRMSDFTPRVIALAPEQQAAFQPDRTYLVRALPDTDGKPATTLYIIGTVGETDPKKPALAKHSRPSARPPARV